MNTSELREALRRDAELAGRPPTDLVHRVAGLRRRSRRRWTTALACACAVAVAVGGLAVLDGLRGDDRQSEAAGRIDAGSGAQAAGADPEALAQAYRETIANAGGAGSRVTAPESLVEYLPNTTYLVRNGAMVTLSDAVVVGHVTSVSPGHAHDWPADAEDRPPVEVPFDDPRALSRTIHAEVAVTEVLAGRITEDTVVVGFGWGTETPFDVAARGLPALGNVLLFLEEDSPVFAHDRAVQYGVAENGALLAEIDAGGRLTFPALEPYWADQFLARNPTLDSLRAAAQEPPRVVPFETLED